MPALPGMAVAPAQGTEAEMPALPGMAVAPAQGTEAEGLRRCNSRAGAAKPAIAAPGMAVAPAQGTEAEGLRRCNSRAGAAKPAIAAPGMAVAPPARCFSRHDPIGCARRSRTEGIAGIQPRELERRRERVRRTWAYRRVDHLPLGFILEDTSRYSVQELCQDGRKQLETNIHSIDRLLRLLPDDYLPVARLWPGYMTIATMFGLAVHWGEDPMQPPGVAEHPIRDLGQVYSLAAPDPRREGLMPFILEWTREFARVLPPEVCLAGPDLGGPLNTAKDLFETQLLYTAPYDDPRAFCHFLELAAEVQASCYREVIAAAGGLERLACIDFDPLWAPEGRKGFVSDDVCAGLSPEHFAKFSRPYNNRIFREWPGGRLHNCGPHPAAGQYLGHDPPINGLNCSFRYTRGELPKLREAFRGRGIVELMFDNGETAGQIVDGFEEALAALVPEVVAVPVVWLSQGWSDEDIRALFEDLHAAAVRGARAMDWVGGD